MRLRQFCNFASSPATALCAAFFFLQIGDLVDSLIDYGWYVPPHGAFAAGADSACETLQTIDVHENLGWFLDWV
jgi:hypothetical protein